MELLLLKPKCYPENKLNYIKRIQLDGENVIMIGGGINNAPFFKTDIGISMGKIGSDIVSDVVNVVLINNIKDLPN